MTEKPSIIQIDLSAASIEEVMREWEREHPGRDATEMSSKEFADRVMAKMMDSATKIEGGTA